jgi:hypothetical protein
MDAGRRYGLHEGLCHRLGRCREGRQAVARRLHETVFTVFHRFGMENHPEYNAPGLCASRSAQPVFQRYKLNAGAVRVPTYNCNDTCIALSGRVQRHLYCDLLGRSAWSLLASVAVAYRDSYPDTIMTRVKSVPLLPCWTWTVFFLCFRVERLFV